MRSFKDKNGCEWPIEIDLSVVTRVKRACSINIIDLVMGKAAEGVSDDPEKVGQLLWSVFEPAAVQKGIGAEAFPKLFNGEAIDAAVSAISLAVADFLSPSRRALAMKVIAKGDEVSAAAITLAMAKVDAVDASTLVTTLSSGPTSSAASPASTPAT